MTRERRPAARRRKGRVATARRRPTGPQRNRRRTDHWPWLISGLAIGLVASTGAWWWLDGRPETPAGNPPPSITGTPGSGPETVAAPEKKRPVTGPDDRRGGDAAQPTDDGPRFDFYRLLPKMEVVIPDEEINRERASLPKRKSRGTFVIQAGSFRRLAEADGLKARLALMGIEADIQTIVVGNGRTWHRVRIGPFRDVRALREIRRRLRRAQIEFVVIELSG